MLSTMPLRALGVLALAMLAAPLLAAPADQVRTRIDGFKALGADFKALNDALRSPSPQAAVLRSATQRIRLAAKRQYGWFPADSGPRPGVKTAAKVDIWKQPQRFRQQQDKFAAQATALERVARGGNVAALKTATRNLGAACKGCHDQFRVED